PSRSDGPQRTPSPREPGYPGRGAGARAARGGRKRCALDEGDVLSTAARGAEQGTHRAAGGVDAVAGGRAAERGGVAPPRASRVVEAARGGGPVHVEEAHRV